jgi:hypothetical protein
VIMGRGRQQSLQRQHERQRREPTGNQAIITDQDRGRVKQLKAEQFISGISCRRVWLDQELDGRTDRRRCEQGSRYVMCVPKKTRWWQRQRRYGKHTLPTRRRKPGIRRIGC